MHQITLVIELFDTLRPLNTYFIWPVLNYACILQQPISVLCLLHVNLHGLVHFRHIYYRTGGKSTKRSQG